MRICDVTFGDNGGSAGLDGVQVVLLQQHYNTFAVSTYYWLQWLVWLEQSSSTSTIVIAVSTTGDNSGSAGLVGVIHRGKRGSGVGLDGSTMSYLPYPAEPYHIQPSHTISYNHTYQF